MWGWIFGILVILLLLYIIFLKQEIKKITQQIMEIPVRASYGSRLFLDFRERALLNLINEINQMIDALEEKNRHAIRMEENVKLSIAGLSHDLRTPLTSIKGYVQLLHATKDEIKRERYLTIIEHSIKRLLAMTEQFYDLARIETNQKEVSLSVIPLSKIVEEVFLNFYEQLEEKGIELQFPESIKEWNVIADPILLTRVIQNMIQNILRYAKSKAVIEYINNENYIILTVKNDIHTDSKIAIEKVFTRFYTEVTSRTNTETSGLGLYLSKQLIEKLDGKMEAELNDNWFILKVSLPISNV